MKLSEKDFDRLHDSAIVAADENKLSSDSVVLSLEEVTKIIDKLKDFGEFYFLQTGNIDQDAVDIMTELMVRVDDLA